MGIFPMGPAYYVIAILGCADGSQACSRVATMPAQFESQQACAASTAKALEANTDFDFPTLVAECQAVSPRPAARRDARPAIVPASARRG
ncbi:MAG TPA: hypothetical protein VM757_01930 [Sphingomicrobium sp.]|nr:hypothetical protein [Sphingomicrobium sp.]